LLLAARTGARTFGRLHALANELPVVLHDAELERQCIEEHYGPRALYREPRYQTRGLWPFEQRALQQFFPAPPARLLVPGAGTGREVLALHALGYQVDGFEPAAPMVALANRALVGAGASPLRQMTLQAWSTHPDGRFDAILAGWAMWTHILGHADRIHALQAFRAVCPAGPVLLSFDRREPYADHTERGALDQALHPPATDRIGRFTRVLLRQRILRRSPVERGTGFRNGVFVHWVDEAELREEGRAAGYRVAYYEHDGSRYPHAVLVPLDS
jgi:hypothetical protein